jgi:hypothetical protein
MSADLIEQWERGGEKLALSVRGLEAEDMTCFPIEGKWSIAQVVMHLMDSDLIATDRMKRTIAEDTPTLIGYDESKFVERLAYHDQSVEDAVTIFDLNRRQFARVLKKVAAHAWDRVGMHNERGPTTLRNQLEYYTKHLDHHLKFIHEKRAKMGKEMW